MIIRPRPTGVGSSLLHSAAIPQARRCASVTSARTTTETALPDGVRKTRRQNTSPASPIARRWCCATRWAWNSAIRAALIQDATITPILSTRVFHVQRRHHCHPSHQWRRRPHRRRHQACLTRPHNHLRSHTLRHLLRRRHRPRDRHRDHPSENQQSVKTSLTRTSGLTSLAARQKA